MAHAKGALVIAWRHMLQQRVRLCLAPLDVAQMRRRLCWFRRWRLLSLLLLVLHAMPPLFRLAALLVLIVSGLSEDIGKGGTGTSPRWSAAWQSPA